MEIVCGNDTDLTLAIRHHHSDHPSGACFAIECGSLFTLLVLIQCNKRIRLNSLLDFFPSQIMSPDFS